MITRNTYEPRPRIPVCHKAVSATQYGSGAEELPIRKEKGGFRQSPSETLIPLAYHLPGALHYHFLDDGYEDQKEGENCDDGEEDLEDGLYPSVH